VLCLGTTAEMTFRCLVDATRNDNGGDLPIFKSIYWLKDQYV